MDLSDASFYMLLQETGDIYAGHLPAIKPRKPKEARPAQAGSIPYLLISSRSSSVDGGSPEAQSRCSSSK